MTIKNMIQNCRLFKRNRALRQLHNLFKLRGDGSDLTLIGHHTIVRSLAVVMGGTRNVCLLSASNDGTTNLWNLTTGKVVRKYSSLGWHQDVSLLNEDRFVVAAQLGITIFDIKSSEVKKEIQSDENIKCVAVSMEDKWFIIGTDSKMIKYDSKSFDIIETYDEGADHIAIIGSDRFVSVKLNSSSFLWTDTTRSTTETFSPQKVELAADCCCVCKVNSSSFLTGSWRGGIQLWNADHLTRKCIRQFGEDDWTTSLSIVNDVLFVSGGHEDPFVAKLWNIDSGECLAIFEGHDDKIYDVVYLPEQKAIATASWDKSIKVWPISQYVEAVESEEENNPYIDLFCCCDLYQPNKLSHPQN